MDELLNKSQVEAVMHINSDLQHTAFPGTMMKTSEDYLH